MAAKTFLGKTFKDEKALSNYKKYIFPRLLAGIEREYLVQNCAEIGITREEWKSYCLVHFALANYYGYKAKIGYIPLMK